MNPWFGLVLVQLSGLFFEVKSDPVTATRIGVIGSLPFAGCDYFSDGRRHSAAVDDTELPSVEVQKHSEA